MNEFSLVSWGFTWHTSGTKSSKSIRQKPLPALPFKRTSFAIYNQHSKLTSGCIEIQPILHIAQKNVEVVLQNCHRWIMKLSKIGMIVFRLLRGFWQAPIICSFPTQLCQRWSGNMGGIYTTKNELALLFSSKKVRDKFYTDKKSRKALIRFVETSGRCRLAARLRIYGLFAGHCIYIYITIYNHILQYISTYDNIFDLEWVFEQCCYPMCCLTFSKPWLGGLKYVWRQAKYMFESTSIGPDRTIWYLCKWYRKKC